MSPKEVRDILTRPAGGGAFSDIVLSMSRSWLDNKSEMGDRLLAALLWYVDSRQLKTVSTPKMGGEGSDNKAEIVAAYLHWEAIDLFGFYYHYTKAREAVYSTYDPDNIERARRFWRIAERMTDIKSAPKGAEYDIIPWKEQLAPGETDEILEKFRQSNIDRKGQWEGKMPLKNEIEFGERPENATLYTNFTMPSVTQQFAPFGEMSRRMKSDKMRVKLTAAEDGVLHINIVGAWTDKQARMPRACVLGLLDIITMNQHSKVQITDEGEGDVALAIKSFLISALVLHDQAAPKWDGSMADRGERLAIRPQIYMGLARAKINGDMLNTMPPAPPEFSRRVSPDEAQALYRYMQWGDIRKGEKVPSWVRLPGVVVE